MSKRWRPDTNEFYKHQFGLRFENYVNIKRVEELLKNITFVKYSGYIFNTLISVPETSDKKVKDNPIIYPQPANDFIWLKGINFDASYHIEIISLNGIVNKSFIISPKQDILINTSDISTGLYFIKIENIMLPFIILR